MVKLWPLMGKTFHLPPFPYIKTLFVLHFHIIFTFPVFETPLSLSNLISSSPTMAKNLGAHSFRPCVRRNSPSPTVSSTPGEFIAGSPSTARAVARPFSPAASPPTATPLVAPAPAAVVATSPTPAAMQGSAAATGGVGSSSVAPAKKRYHTRVGPTPPAPSHPRPSRRAPPPKRARTSGRGESSTSRPPAPPSPPYKGIVRAPDLSPASIIRWPYFHCSPIPGNANCSERDMHREVYYDLPTYTEDPELRGSMLLVQIYHRESFMTPHHFFYPRVVIEFYNTMTSRREANPITLHFSIDGRQGILRASDITAALYLPVVLTNTLVYRQWPHPSTSEMVRLLSMDTTAGTILFRRQLPQRMLLIAHPPKERRYF